MRERESRIGVHVGLMLSPMSRLGLMLCKDTHCVGCVLANTNPRQLYWCGFGDCYLMQWTGLTCYMFSIHICIVLSFSIPAKITQKPTTPTSQVKMRREKKRKQKRKRLKSCRKQENGTSSKMVRVIHMASRQCSTVAKC